MLLLLSSRRVRAGAPVAAGLTALLALASAPAAFSHGADGQAGQLAPGQFRAQPLITIEGHGGLENNLEGAPRHYAVDLQMGTVLEWGLPRGGMVAIEMELSAAYLPYLITASQGEDVRGLRQQLAFAGTLALGDGDLNFALGNYTESRLGLGFNVDLLNVSLDAGPRFYQPGSYAGLAGRVDWGGEIELTYPLSGSTVLFAHWEPIYNTQAGLAGWVHHVGAGVTFRF